MKAGILALLTEDDIKEIITISMLTDLMERAAGTDAKEIIAVVPKKTLEFLKSNADFD